MFKNEILKIFQIYEMSSLFYLSFYNPKGFGWWYFFKRNSNWMKFKNSFLSETCLSLFLGIEEWWLMDPILLCNEKVGLIGSVEQTKALTETKSINKY